MNWIELTHALFGSGHSVTRGGATSGHGEEDVLHGTGQLDQQTIAIIGTTEHTPIGIETALAQARLVLETVQHFPGRPILLLVDTQGQRLRHRDELLCINRYMAHLGCCLDLARRSGHRIIGLVYDQALSGGFITSGLMADACYALPEAEIRVMRLPAMARVTKISEEVLTELSRNNPVFAPGVGNFVAMGGIQSLWDAQSPDALRNALRSALADTNTSDRRAALGAARGGRSLAERTALRVLSA